MFKWLSVGDDMFPAMEQDKVPLFYKGRIRVRIIYEDNHYKDFMTRLPKSYFFKIHNGYYLIVPKCIMRGKVPTITYYYNNPLPLEVEHKSNKQLRAIDFYSKQQREQMTLAQETTLTNVYIDSDALRSAMETRLIKGLYEGSAFITGKNFFLILAVLSVVIMVILQVTGTVDILGFFSAPSG